MYIRFAGALIVVVAISLAGIALEKRILELRRTVSHQAFQLDVLLEQHAASRLRAQELGSPLRLQKYLQDGPAPPTQSAEKSHLRPQ